MDYLSKSYRLDTEVLEWLDGLKNDYGSVNKGLRAAMAVFNDEAPMPQRVEVERERALRRVEPQTIPGVQVGAANIQQGFPCRCVHTGCQGKPFQGSSRFEKICPACREAGHGGDPKGCIECFNDQGPA